MSNEQNEFERQAGAWLEMISDQDVDFWQRIEPNLAPQVAQAVRDLYPRYVEARWRQGRTYSGLEEWMCQVMLVSLQQQERACRTREREIRQSLAEHFNRTTPVRIAPKERKSQ